MSRIPRARVVHKALHHPVGTHLPHRLGITDAFAQGLTEAHLPDTAFCHVAPPPDACARLLRA